MFVVKYDIIVWIKPTLSIKSRDKIVTHEFSTVKKEHGRFTLVYFFTVHRFIYIPTKFRCKDKNNIRLHTSEIGAIDKHIFLQC